MNRVLDWLTRQFKRDPELEELIDCYARFHARTERRLRNIEKAIIERGPPCRCRADTSVAAFAQANSVNSKIEAPKGSTEGDGLPEAFR